ETGGPRLLPVNRRQPQGGTRGRKGRCYRVLLPPEQFHGLLHRTAPAVDRPYRRVQAPVDCRRLLEGLREEPAAAADLRDALPDRGAARRAPASSGGGQK